jgi:structural maintenance of chromosome 3 (chondroitin sulfate proteoglycan 6)
VEDLQAAGERAGGKREQLQAELAEVQAQIEEKEADLLELIPEWETQKEHEIAERRNLDHARSQLQALYGKQGRLNRFRTKAERDTFLRHEIASIEAYQKTQGVALESVKSQLGQTRRSLQEVEGRIKSSEENIEEGRGRATDLVAQVSALKNQSTDLTEQRKELWREDTKLQSLVTHAADELRTAERALASMMDKVFV